MPTTLHTRAVAEHLATLACLLEAEATRARACGQHSASELARQAGEVRTLCDQLWQADSTLLLDADDTRQPPNNGKVVHISATG